MSLFWKKEIILIMLEIVSCIAPPLPTPCVTQPSIHLYPARMFLTWVLLFAWDRISRQDARKFAWAVGLKFLMTRVESSNPALDSNHFSESHQQRYTVKVLICDFIPNKHMVIQAMKISSDLMAHSRKIAHSSSFMFPNVSLCICIALQCLDSI